MDVFRRSWIPPHPRPSKIWAELQTTRIQKGYLITSIWLPLELCHSASEESSLHLLAITIYVSSASENGCQLGGYAGGAGAGAPLWFPTFEDKTCVQLDSFKALSEHRITRIRRIGWMSTAILVADIPKSCHSEGPESVESDWRLH